MPYCIKCGREVGAGANFCPYCGQRVVQPRKEPPISQVARPTPAHGNGKLAKLIGGVVAVIALVIALVIVLPPLMQKILPPAVKADIDKDGIPDDVEVKLGLNPRRMDIVVEVDWMEGTTLNTVPVVKVFKDAPIRNLDGSWGVDLHIIWSDRVPAKHVNTSEFLDYRGKYRNLPYAYYCLLANSTGRGGLGDEAGFSMGSLGIAVEAKTGILAQLFGRGTMSIEFIFLHELGHTLGLNPEVFEGIDSYRYSWDQYPSAMNYNQPWWGLAPKMQFSSGGVFDDWAYLGREGFTPPVP